MAADQHPPLGESQMPERPGSPEENPVDAQITSGADAAEPSHSGSETVSAPPPEPARAPTRSWLSGSGIKLLNEFRKAMIGALAVAIIAFPLWIVGGPPSVAEVQTADQGVHATSGT